MAYLSQQFCGLDEPDPDLSPARATIMPVPFERTTSYRKGTAQGPAAILAASTQVELYDQELDTEPADAGIRTLPPFVPEAFDLAQALEELRGEARAPLEAGSFLVVLGGEHSLTLGPVLAARDVHGTLGVVQFDAHADLRQSYEGTRFSHASVMRRIVGWSSASTRRPSA